MVCYLCFVLWYDLASCSYFLVVVLVLCYFFLFFVRYHRSCSLFLFVFFVLRFDVYYVFLFFVLELLCVLAIVVFLG